MTTRDELHALVNQLSDDDIAAASAYVRRLAQHPHGSAATAQERLAQRMAPPAVTGVAFVAQSSADLTTLATRQGVRPVENFDDLLTDIWPQDEDIDTFSATLRRWRHEREDDQGHGD